MKETCVLSWRHSLLDELLIVTFKHNNLTYISMGYNSKIKKTANIIKLFLVNDDMMLLMVVLVL